jgi:hypothetical protein
VGTQFKESYLCAFTGMACGLSQQILAICERDLADPSQVIHYRI